MAPISVAELKEHISFVRAVHTDSSRGDESLYVDGNRLRAAVRAYLAWLAARAAAAPFGGIALVTCPPPLDIAWVWHVHRLAPREYARACAALGTFVAPATGVGFAYSQAAPAASALESKEMEDTLVAAVGRHASFLWQVSGAEYNDDEFLSRAITRYEHFASLKASAKGGLAPPVDVDLAWHTHMLRGADYEAESAAMSGGAGALDHDNGEGVAGARLDASWACTLDAWSEGDGLALEAVPSGARRRGDPPPWWFGSGGGVLVIDAFLDVEEIAAVVAQMPDPSEAVVGGGGVTGGRGHGKDARAHVEVDACVEGRIKAAVSCGLGMPVDDGAAAKELQTGATADAPAAPATLPARVSVGKMGLHRDRLAVKQGGGEAMLADFADGYIAVVYLSTGGTLLLEPDDAPGEGDAAWVPTALARREIAVEAGRLVAWPNYAYKHGAGLAGGDAARWILGPVALLPGRARLAQSGDCSAPAADPADCDDNDLHRLCGGSGRLVDRDLHARSWSGGLSDYQIPTVEAIRALGSEDRLKELAAYVNTLGATPLHCLCAHPKVTAAAVRFVGALFPKAAAQPLGPIGFGSGSGKWNECGKLPLHILCENVVNEELVCAVGAIYPAAVSVRAMIHVYLRDPVYPTPLEMVKGEFTELYRNGMGESTGMYATTILARFKCAEASRLECGEADVAAWITRLEEQAKTPEAVELEEQVKADRVEPAMREVEAMFGPDGGAAFVEGRFKSTFSIFWEGREGRIKSTIALTDAHMQFLVPRLHAAVEINLSDNWCLTGLSEIGRGCPELTSLNISGCKNVTDLSEIGRGCPKLTSLNISRNPEHLLRILRGGSLSSKLLQLIQQSLDFRCVGAHSLSFARAPRWHNHTQSRFRARSRWSSQREQDV